jgi:tRNA 2-thiouridine synthesizing protein D
MRFALMVTGPAYGTQQASSALQFAHALLEAGHELVSVFFYREGVYNANQFTSPASDEFDLVRAWQALNEKQGVELHICVAAALRRGVTDATEAARLGFPGKSQAGFSLSGLGALAQAALTCDRWCSSDESRGFVFPLLRMVAHRAVKGLMHCWRHQR